MPKKTVIILFIFLLILAWSLVGFSFSPLAVVFDDFDDNATDPTKWGIALLGDRPIISEANSRLEITLPSDSKDASGRTYFGAGYISICSLRGDFDLQADYTLIDWPSNNGVRVGLSLDSNYDPPREYDVQRISFGNMDFPEQPREVYLYGGGDGAIATADLSGTLRLKRAGALLTAYYMSSGNWVTLSTVSITQADLHFAVSIWSHSYAFTNQNVKVAFDNLTILQGEVICPDESTPTATPTAMLTSTPTFVSTALPTPTTIPTLMPTGTPETHLIYLPLVALQPTSTPTVTPTALPTHTPTATPTEEPRPLLEDGSYKASFTGQVDGWISFRVTNNGTRATSADFLISNQNPMCSPVSYSFSGSKPIENGKFWFFHVDQSGLAIDANLTCVSVSATRLLCDADRHFHGNSGVYAFCNVADGEANRQ